MIITVPIEGTVLSKDPLSGDPADPIRMVKEDLGDVSWRLISTDLEAEEFTIEIVPSPSYKEHIHTVAELEALKLSAQSKAAGIERKKRLRFLFSHRKVTMRVIDAFHIIIRQVWNYLPTRGREER